MQLLNAHFDKDSACDQKNSVMICVFVFVFFCSVLAWLHFGLNHLQVSPWEQHIETD